MVQIDVASLLLRLLAYCIVLLAHHGAYVYIHGDLKLITKPKPKM